MDSLDFPHEAQLDNYFESFNQTISYAGEAHAVVGLWRPQDNFE